MNKDQIDVEYKREVLRALRSIAKSLDDIHKDLANSTAPLIEEKET